jgi:hypothetical protein
MEDVIDGSEGRRVSGSHRRRGLRRKLMPDHLERVPQVHTQLDKRMLTA